MLVRDDDSLREPLPGDFVFRCAGPPPQLRACAADPAPADSWRRAQFRRLRFSSTSPRPRRSSSKCSPQCAPSSSPTALAAKGARETFSTKSLALKPSSTTSSAPRRSSPTPDFLWSPRRLHLGKPYLAVPVRNQFEQIFNAFWLDRTGYGAFWEELTKERVESFLFNLPHFRDEARRVSQDLKPGAFWKAGCSDCSAAEWE